jgi:hypothetical protein
MPWKLAVWAAVLGIAHAGHALAATYQWREVDKSMVELLQEGYELKSVVHVPVGFESFLMGDLPAKSTELWEYYLQKSSSLYACVERHAYDGGEIRAREYLCLELVEPYEEAE